MTPTQLDEMLTAKLSEKYLQNPDVSVGLKSSARRNVTVDGSVNQPGMYPINGPTTLLQAISMARGTSPDSNPRRVAIFRTIDGKRAAAAFDLHSIRRGEMQDPQVYSGDIVVVDGSRLRQAQQQILMSLPIIGMFNPLIF
jgi:polysaccharide export outer membrane protein